MKAPAVWLFAGLAALLLCANGGWHAIAGAAICVACLVVAAVSDKQLFVHPSSPVGEAAGPHEHRRDIGRGRSAGAASLRSTAPGGSVADHTGAVSPAGDGGPGRPSSRDALAHRQPGHPIPVQHDAPRSACEATTGGASEQGEQ